MKRDRFAQDREMRKNQKYLGNANRLTLLHRIFLSDLGDI